MWFVFLLVQINCLLRNRHSADTVKKYDEVIDEVDVLQVFNNKFQSLDEPHKLAMFDLYRQVSVRPGALTATGSPSWVWSNGLKSLYQSPCFAYVDGVQ